MNRVSVLCFALVSTIWAVNAVGMGEASACKLVVVVDHGDSVLQLALAQQHRSIAARFDGELMALKDSGSPADVCYFRYYDTSQARDVDEAIRTLKSRPTSDPVLKIDWPDWVDQWDSLRMARWLFITFDKNWIASGKGGGTVRLCSVDESKKFVCMSNGKALNDPFVMADWRMWRLLSQGDGAVSFDGGLPNANAVVPGLSCSVIKANNSVKCRENSLGWVFTFPQGKSEFVPAILRDAVVRELQNVSWLPPIGEGDRDVQMSSCIDGSERKSLSEAAIAIIAAGSSLTSCQLKFTWDARLLGSEFSMTALFNGVSWGYTVVGKSVSRSDRWLLIVRPAFLREVKLDTKDAVKGSTHVWFVGAGTPSVVAHAKAALKVDLTCRSGDVVCLWMPGANGVEEVQLEFGRDETGCVCLRHVAADDMPAYRYRLEGRYYGGWKLKSVKGVPVSANPAALCTPVEVPEKSDRLWNCPDQIVGFSAVGLKICDPDLVSCDY